MAEFSRLVKRYQDLSHSESLGELIWRGLDKLGVYAETPLKKMTYAKQTFNLNDRSFNYAVHSYNATWRNERAVEVPIMLDFLDEHHNKRILEVGNVSCYYRQITHDVVDKYENSENGLNIDIMDYHPKDTYDAFLAISTFEHIGWDETPKEPEKVMAAVNHVYNLVKDRSAVLISCPLGYNDAIDDYINTDAFPFQEVRYMTRIDRSNRWVETDKEEAMKNKYDSLYPAANGIFVGRGLI
ncbi:MAG: hypothetical protein CMP10_18160 [Zetaproteobacteria bacterium]|nr:hypothetical protein [Pseudobdellovibrionaceae bacterium]